MYRAMLAEDEPEVLQAILDTIRWEEYGFERPLGCRDGREALEAMQQGYRPDMIITDICMPFADGLEVAKYVGEHLPETLVVILTGYDDFPYAQKAIRLQVYDYILKPVTPVQLNALLARLRDELDRRRARSAQDAQDSMQIVAGHFLGQLLTKRMDAESIAAQCERCGLVFAGEVHTVCVLDLDLPVPTDMERGADQELMRYGLHNIAAELATAREGVLAVQGGDGLSKLIASARSAEQAYALCEELAGEIAGAVQKHLGDTVSAGIGVPVTSLEQLAESHAQAMEALRYRFFYGEGSVIREEDICTCGEKGEQAVDYASCERRFRDSLKALDRQGVQAAMEELFQALSENHIPIEKCFLYGQKLIMETLSLTADIVGEQDVADLEKAWEQQNLYGTVTLDRLKGLVFGFCEKAFEVLQLVRNDPATAQVHKAETYIREHYSNPELSLNTITEHLSISTSYFSAIFKSKTGATFVEYLTRVRMEKAKQLLAFTDRRAYEAAEAVGYTDPHYFSVTFKRLTGMTPKEYREHCKREGGAGAK